MRGPVAPACVIIGELAHLHAENRSKQKRTNGTLSTGPDGHGDRRAVERSVAPRANEASLRFRASRTDEHTGHGTLGEDDERAQR